MQTSHYIKTARLTLRDLAVSDAAFVLKLLNEPDWIAFIGDKDVRNLDDASHYITNSVQKMYRQWGVGLLLVETNDQSMPIGLCGLLQRDNLEIPDLGFAFSALFRRQGYAYEAATGVLTDAYNHVERIAAITALNNEASIKLLKKLGFIFVGLHHMTEDSVASNLFEMTQERWLKTLAVK